MSKSKHSKKKGKRISKAASKSSGVYLGLYNWWKEKNPVFAFLGKFILILIILHLVRYTSFYMDVVHPALTSANAYLSHLILNVFAQQTISSGSLVQSSEFSMNIAHGCDAVEAVMIFVSVVLAFPVNIKKRLIGVFIGAAFLLFINLFRVISLFLIGVYFKDWFDFMHIEVWQFIFILLALITCAIWIRWALPKIKTDQSD